MRIRQQAGRQVERCERHVLSGVKHHTLQVISPCGKREVWWLKAIQPRVPVTLLSPF